MRARYALSVLLTPWAALIVAALMLFNASMYQKLWLDELQLIVDNQGRILAVTLPIVAGLAAFDVSRSVGPSTKSRWITDHERQRDLSFVLAWACSAVIGVYLIIVGSALARAIARHGDVTALPGALLEVLVHCAIITLFIALGGAMGRHLNAAWAGLGTVVTGYALLAWGGSNTYNGDGFGALNLGGATVSRLGLELSMPFALSQVVLAFLVIVLWTWPPRSQHWSPQANRGSAIAALTVGAVALGAFASVLPSTRWLENPQAPTDCRGTAPVICTYPEHKQAADRWDPDVRSMFDAVRREGYGSLVPDKVEEISRTYAPSGSVAIRSINLSDVENDSDTRTRLAAQLTSPVHCAFMSADVRPSDAYHTDFDKVFNVLMVASSPASVRASGKLPVIVSPQEAEETLRRLWSCNY